MRVKAESSELFGLSSLLEAILQEIRRQAYILNIFESFVIVESSNIDWRKDTMMNTYTLPERLLFKVEIF